MREAFVLRASQAAGLLHLRPVSALGGAILEGLLSKRERQANIGSLRVAEALDDTILAVAYVVQQCRQTKAALTDASHG